MTWKLAGSTLTVSWSFFFPWCLALRLSSGASCFANTVEYSQFRAPAPERRSISLFFPPGS